MRQFFIAALAIGVSVNAEAQSVELPKVEAGDTWTYRTTVEKAPSGWVQKRDEIVVIRSTASSIYYTSKEAGSTQPPTEKIAGIDWSRVRDVNGKQTIVNRPLAFPIEKGKTWVVEYTEQHPNKIHRFEQFSDKFVVVGPETVEVPAGKFNAIKIESEGQWTAQREPMQTIVQGAESQPEGVTGVTHINRVEASTASGRLYKAFWYSPEVKRWVKSVEEYYGSNGVRNERYTGELESFKVN